MSQVYMTAKLNLADGTILYPQVSLDNIVASISDPTLVSVATTTNGVVPTSELPVVTVVGTSASNTSIPTEAAVRALADTKQDTLVEGVGTTIINGSTIMFNASTLDVSVIDTTESNGVALTLTGNTVGLSASFATDSTAGVIAGATNGVGLVDGIVVFDPTTAVGANGSTPGAITTVGAGLSVSNGSVAIDEATVKQTIDGISSSTPISDKVVTPAAFQGALSAGKAVDVTSEPSANAGTLAYATDIRGTITWSTTAAGTVKIGFYDSSTAFPKYASGLVYILMADVKNTSGAAVTVSFGGTALNGTAGSIAAGATKRIAFTFDTSTSAYFQFTAAASTTLEITKLRELEVTGCFQTAREYIAALSDPDDFSKFYAVDYDEVNPWTPYIDMGTSPAATLMSGLAYKLNATSGTHVLTTDICPTGYYGEDAHLKLFVGETGSVQFVAPLNLIDALTPNAGHNITIKYRDGQANAYVDDTDIGYVVTVTSGTADGSLAYALTNDVGEYVVFSHSTDGQEIVVDEPVALSRAVSIIGNGPENTIVKLTGGTSYGFSSNNRVFSFSGITIKGITTSANYCIVANDENTVVSDCVITGNTANSGTFYIQNSALISGVSFLSNAGYSLRVYRGLVNVVSCYFENEDASAAITDVNNPDRTVQLLISGSTFAASKDSIQMTNIASFVTFTGSNVVNSTVRGVGMLYGKDASISGTGTISLAGSTTAFTATNTALNGMLITGASTSTTGALVGTDITLQNVTVTGNTISDADGTLAITGSTSAVSVPHAAVEVGPECSFAITGGSFSMANDVLISGSSITGSLGGTVVLTGKISAFGTGADLTIADNTVIDMTGNNNTTAIIPGGDIIVGSGVKAVTTDGSTVNVTGGTYKEGSISNAGVPSDNHHIYGFDRQVTLNNPAVSFVELTDTSASGSARYTGISAADWKTLKKGLLETRACVMYSNKTTKPGGKKNKVMFYLSNSDFRYKENGQKLTADELLGKVTWEGAVRLCNFMKIYPKMWIKVEEYGDPCIFSQTTSTATSQVAWKRDPDSDVSGASFGWKNGSTVIWTATVNPAAGDKTYSNNTCTIERDWPVVYYCLEHFVVLVSDRQDTDFILHPWFWTSEDGQTASDQYVGMFKGVACDANGNILTPVESTAGDFRTLGNPAIGTGMVRSIPGGRPACSNTLNNFRMYLGRAGVDATNAMFDWYKDLMLVFDTGYFDAQSRISGGLNLMQAYYWFELRQTGRTMQFGNRTCSMNFDAELDADIAGYWNGRIASKAASGDSSTTNWQRNPANDKIANNTVSAYAWTAKISNVDTYIWTATAEPAADDATYSDNTLTTVRTGCPVVSYTNAAGVRCTTFSWRGLEDIWGACWEFRDGVQKRQDAVNTGFTATYIESGYMVTNAISLYTSTDLLPSPSDSVNNLPKTVTASLLTSSITYANSSVSLVKNWDKMSGTGTGLTQCFVQHPWPKKGGNLNLWDPLTNYPVMVAASALNSAYNDYSYNDAAAGSRVLFVGGDATCGGNDGPGCVRLHLGLGHSPAYIGVRPAASEN